MWTQNTQTVDFYFAQMLKNKLKKAIWMFNNRKKGHIA